MRVADLAKELNISEQVILDKLKALKMKAGGPDQEVSMAARMVVRAELEKQGLVEPEKEAPAKKAVKRTVKKAVKKAVKKPSAKSESKASPKKKEPVRKRTALEKDDEPEEVAPKPEPKAVEKKPSAGPTDAAAQAVESQPVKTVKPAASPVQETTAKTEPEPAKGPVHKPFKPPVETVQPLKKKSKAPEFVTVKPLARRRRKGGKGGGRTEEHEIIDESIDETTYAHLQDIELDLPIAVKDLSLRIQQKPNVVLKQLMKYGIFATINQSLDEKVVRKICGDLGFNLIKTKTQEEQVFERHAKEEENQEDLATRAPVVTFMGHVDHGKTSLLDKIRSAKVVDSEHGGITQHIGAYSVETERGRVTFLDTPGHEAFTSMRARGAHVTDLVVLVVAADEGIKPQTEEAIDHAQAAGVPMIVAINKMDRPNANADQVKKELMERGLTPEDWGGKTVTVGVSALTGQGIDDLLEMIILEAEVMELKANPKKPASGIVVEAHVSPGKGVVTSLIVQSGTLRDGDFIVVGPHYGKVKALFDDLERPINEAGPSMPVEVLGLSNVPDAGEQFFAVDEKQARDIAEKRREKLKKERLESHAKVTLEDLYSQIQDGAVKEFNVILKADVQGSLEALRESLEKITRGNKEVRTRFIHCGVGDVNGSDVILAVASKAVIIAFNVGTGPKAAEELEKNPVDIRSYRIIYDAVNDIRDALEGMLEPDVRRNFMARVTVKEVFKLSKSGTVAGCIVDQGKIKSRADVDVIRNGDVVFTGKVATLKRFKDDVKEVPEGTECGIVLDKFSTYEPGDIIEAYTVERIARKL